MEAKRIIIYLFGMFITYLGTALAVKSTLGAGFWSAFFVGASESVGLTAGVWFGLTQFVLVFFNAELGNRRPDWYAFIPIIVESLFFDFWLTIVFGSVSFESFPIGLRIVIFTSALLIASFGIGLYLFTGLPRSPVDQLFVTISETFKLTIGKAQTVVAIMITSLAFALGGPVGVGTVLSVFLIGPFIQWWVNRLASFSIFNQTPR